MPGKKFLHRQRRFPLRCEDPVLARYDRLGRINSQVMAALDADVPGPDLAALLADLQAAMADLEKAEAENIPDADTIPARLAGARTLKAQAAAVQERLAHKSRELVRQRQTSNHTRQALDAYAQKK
jgi:hypothetical protein